MLFFRRLFLWAILFGCIEPGCSKRYVYRGKLEQAIGNLLTVQHVEFSKLECPDKIEAKTGVRFTCLLERKNGVRLRVTFREESNDGDLIGEGDDLVFD